MKEKINVIIKKELKELTPYANNAKIHTQSQIEKIKASIMEFGYNDPIEIDEKGVILVGHGRYEALKQLKYETIGVIQHSHMSEVAKKQYIIANNQTTLETGFNEDILALELEALKELGADLELTGIEADEIEALGTMTEGIEAEELEEKEVEAQQDEIPVANSGKFFSKKGDIWLLGEHRLMCGDSTDLESVILLMNGEKATLGHNDPPYGMKKEKDGVTNDNLNFNDLLKFNEKWIKLQFQVLDENGSFYCWGTDEPLMDIYSGILKPLISEQKATFRNLITWNKGNGQGQNSDLTRSYAIADEKCLFLMCGVQGFNNNSNNYFEGWEPIRDYLLESRLELGWDIPTMKRVVGHSDLSRDHWTSKSQFNLPTKKTYEALQAGAREQEKKEGKEYRAFSKEYDEIKKEYDEIKKEYYGTRAYFNNTHDNMNNVWNIKRTPTSEKEQAGGHATPKPIELCARVIKSSSRKNDIVLDMFGGSGSTLITCEQLERICYTMEYEERWVDVIVKRYKNTGKEDIKVLRNGVIYNWEDVKEG